MKQKLLAILLVLGMVGALIPVFAVTSAAANGVALPDGATAYDGTPSTELSGTGTESDPYIIANTADFMYFYNTLAASATADQVFKMTGDVYWNAQNSTKYAVSSQNFAGILDGDGHTVYNAFFSAWGSKTVFGTVTGTIKNLIFEGTTFTANNGSIGGVCVTVKGGTVDNVHLKNAAIAGQNIGGIANGISGNATISNCTVEGTIGYAGGNQGSLGGIVCSIGAGESGTIKNCVNRASITDNSSKVSKIGGVIASAWSDGSSIVSLTISNCQNYGDIYETMSADKGGAGGILGACSRLNNLLIENCANYGSIQTATLAGTGGVVGYCTYKNSIVVVDGCQNAADITSSGNCVGGLIGTADALQKDLTIKNCAVTGTISGVDNIGGVVGSHATDAYTGSNIIIANSYVDANVVASGSYAGLTIGHHKVNDVNMTATVQNCVVLGTVTANTNAGAVLGMLTINDGHSKSFAPKVSIANSFIKADVIVGADGKAATLVGGANSSVTDITLTSTDAAILVSVKVGDASVSEPVTYYIGTGDGMTAEVATLAAKELTDKTAVTKLNAYATANLLVEWAQGANAPELTLFYVAPETPSIAIDGASLTVGDNVTLNLFVNKATVDAANISLDKIYIVSGSGEYLGTLENDKYVFKITGLLAKEFGVNKTYAVKYTTTDGDTVVSDATKDYSPLQYAINMYGKHPEMETLDPLLLAIVNYADVAGGTGAKIDFVTAVFTVADTSVIEMAWAKLPWYDQVLTGDTGSYTYPDHTDLPKFEATLTETLTLTATLTGSGYKDLSVKIGGEELATVTDGEVTVSGLYATDLYNTMVLTYTTDAGETVSVTWSLMQYLDSFQGSSDAELAEAVAIYLYAARAFCIANHN